MSYAGVKGETHRVRPHRGITTRLISKGVESDISVQATLGIYSTEQCPTKQNHTHVIFIICVK